MCFNLKFVCGHCVSKCLKEHSVVFVKKDSLYYMPVVGLDSVLVL